MILKLIAAFCTFLRSCMLVVKISCWWNARFFCSFGVFGFSTGQTWTLPFKSSINSVEQCKVIINTLTSATFWVMALLLFSRSSMTFMFLKSVVIFSVLRRSSAAFVRGGPSLLLGAFLHAFRDTRSLDFPPASLVSPSQSPCSSPSLFMLGCCRPHFTAFSICARALGIPFCFICFECHLCAHDLPNLYFQPRTLLQTPDSYNRQLLHISTWVSNRHCKHSTSRI